MTEQLTMPHPIPDKRPNQSDPWVTLATAKDLAALLAREFPDEFAADKAGLEEQLADVLRSCLSSDGYEIMRLLERRYHWDGDSALVDLLNHAGGLRYKHTDEAEKLWVRETGKRLDLSIGARVTVPHVVLKTFQRIRVEGEICRLDPERYRYHVFCESLGHIRESDLLGPDGRHTGRTGTLSLVVNAEDVEAMACAFVEATRD